MITNGRYYLITTDSWFLGPDGDQYKAVWGKCEIKNVEETLGFKPIRPSTNWFILVGEGDQSMIVAGCQIHFAIETKDRPIIKTGNYETTEHKKLPYNDIYLTE